MPLPTQLVPLVTAQRTPGLAASLASASTQSLSVASNSTLLVASVDFWLSCWFNATTFGSFNTLMSKYNSDAYWLYLQSTGTSMSCRLNGVNTVTKSVSLSAGVWYHAFYWRDHANGTHSICLDGGSPTTASYATAAGDSGAALYLGTRSGADHLFNGGFDSACFGKSPPGGVAAIATTIRDRLYNGGRYLDLRRIPYGEWSSWGGVSAWPLREGTGTRYNVWGNNHLTDNNGVTVAAGRA